MNILAQVLPGLRDLRVPLALGLLWLTTFALLFRQLPPTVATEGADALREFQPFIEVLPNAVKLSVAAIGVYLLGVLAEEVGRLIGMIVSAVRPTSDGQVTGLVALGVLFALGTFMEQLWIPLLALLTFMLAIAYISWRVDGRRLPFTTSLVKNSLPLALRGLREWLLQLADILARAWSPTAEQVDFFVAQRDLTLLERPEFLQELLRTSDTLDLAVLAERVGLEVREALEGLTYEDMEPLPTDWRDFYNAIQGGTDKHALTRAAIKDVRLSLMRSLTRAAESDPHISQMVVSRLYDRRAVRREVARRVEEANVRLKAEQPALYDEYDRLIAEGEFRRSTAVPVAALLGAVAATADDQLGLTPTQWAWVAGALACVSLAMFSAGRYKSLAATRLLYASVRQEVIEGRHRRA